ncbi:eIF-2-alpha kinase activator GCN1-like [Rhagoletis pomonella]|uniref:eIF-2-alpha kinase activator GCN1-like n=1 Tax=Rhagoletis pomonella TaxID=28610 RepID=UPI001784C852|nr:eIF-2-alpha kinase activator GCN1-like [Rhagoletis pomonella]
MADVELSKALRDLPNRVLSVSIEERPDLFRNVASILNNPGVNAAIVKGICKVIGTTLFKYKDSPSQLLVRNLIVDIIKRHHDAAVENFCAVIKSVINKDLTTFQPQKSAKFSLIAIGWTDIIIKTADINSKIFIAEYTKIVDYQSLLYQHILLSRNTRIIEMGEKIFFDSWQNIEIYKLCFSTAIGKEPSCNIVIFLMLLVRFEKSINREDYFGKYKCELRDHFVKGIIMNKTKLNDTLIFACRPLLQVLTQIEFEESIYPALHKSILRSPEVSIKTMSIVLLELNIDLSQYAMSFGKILLQNLYCKNDKTRHESLETLKNLSQKCVTLDSVEFLLNGIFAILNGQNGKITVAEYRMNLIQVSSYYFRVINKTYIFYEDYEDSKVPYFIQIPVAVFSEEVSHSAGF